MWPQGIHSPAPLSRARVFERVRQRPSGSNFSPSVDAFHLSFPASIDHYISEPCNVNEKDCTRNCQDSCPCQVDSASLDGSSAEIHCASDVHAEAHGDKVLPGTSGPIFNLPPELSDLILSYLSPAALDAARHTCKAWRTRILSSTWILSSVLGIEERSPLDGSRSTENSHRNLLKKLDCDSDLPSTSQHLDAWRTRFRTRTLDFSISSSSSILTRPSLVAATRTGTQNGFLAFQLQEPTPGTKHGSQSTLVIYRFDLGELPCYAGAVRDVKGQGALHITSVLEIRRHAEWVLKIEIGDTAGLYSLTARDGFSNTDSRFSLKPLESLEKLPSLSIDKSAIRDFDRPPEAIPIGSQSWNIIAPFPSNGLRQVDRFESLCRHNEPRFLAEQTSTGNIHVVRKVGASQKPSQCASLSQPESLPNDSESGDYYFTSIALLSRPRSNSVYRNIAIAPTNIKVGSVRAAIVWQTSDSEGRISELYIYDTPDAVYSGPCGAHSQNISDSVSATVEDFNGGAPPRPCRLVQGKRVTSLDPHMGGIHPSSPLYHLASPQEISLGGLQFPHTAEDQEAYPRNVQYQKCFAWGPASVQDDCTQVSMKIFDFSFADPQRLHSLATYGVAAGWRLPRKSHHIVLDSLHCACALHDDGFQITLPDVTTLETHPHSNKTAPTPRQKITALRANLSSLNNGTSWSLWPRNAPTAAPDHAPNVGSMSCNDSGARKAALERRQEWLRRRIVGMKRAGLTDFEIAEMWNVSAWTRYGMVRKPEGWRELA